MQQLQESPLKVLLQFTDPMLFRRAMTFKSFQQECVAKNKGLPYGNNDELIDFGQEALHFLYTEFLFSQGYPKSDGNIFKSFSEISASKQTLLNEVELAKVSKLINLEFQLSTNSQTNRKYQENPKFHSQAIKALIGAQYLDKQKDINKIKKILFPLYEELLKGLKFVKSEQPINHKGLFQEYVQSIKSKFEIDVKLVQNENFNLSENKLTYKMILSINDLDSIEKEGSSKKEVERQLFKDALQMIKDPKFQKLLDERFKKEGVEESFISEVNRTYDSNLDKSQSELISQIPTSIVSQPGEGILEDFEKDVLNSISLNTGFVKYDS